MKKRILQLLIFIILSGCNSIPINNIAPGYLETFKSIKNALIGFEDNTITQQLIDNIPYASMTLKIGKGPKGLMILESFMSEEYTWISADSIYLIIKDGRIIKSDGLENDLKGIIFPNIDFKDVLDGSVKQFKAYYIFREKRFSTVQKFSDFWRIKNHRNNSVKSKKI